MRCGMLQHANCSYGTVAQLWMHWTLSHEACQPLLSDLQKHTFCHMLSSFSSHATALNQSAMPAAHSLADCEGPRPAPLLVLLLHALGIH